MVDAHPIILRGADPTHRTRGPLLLERTEQRVMPAVLGALGGEGGLSVVAKSKAATHDADGMLRLFQPIHRTFYIALLEIACDVFGEPRLDPTKIIGAGLVIRRKGTSTIEGWRQSGATLRGWLSFTDETEERLDPDPKHRPARSGAGHPEIDRLLALRYPFVEQLTESYSPLYVASPEICETNGRTLLYGLVRLTSSEQSETPTTPPSYSDDQLQPLKDHFPAFLKNGAGKAPSLPRPSATLGPGDVDALAADSAGSMFLLMLRQLAIELNVFGSNPFGPSAETKALYQEIDTLQLTFDDGSQRGAAAFLADAATALIERAPGSSVTMPKSWPAVASDQAERIFQASLAVLGSQYSNIAPRAGRFDGIGRQYVARAFARVKHDDDQCPPETVWSAYSEPFTIAPWYETGNAAPVTIVLPDATDRDFLKKVKPNVAFVVPPKLMNCINRNLPTDWLKGNVGESCGDGISLMWICSFSLPIITLCAFIVLSIFLALFDLIFRWLLFIRICIPFPMPRKS